MHTTEQRQGGGALPGKLSELRQKLGQKAKQEPKFRFYALYDRIYRADVRAAAMARVRRNGGAPGIDGVTFEQIERQEGGLGRWREQRREELRTKSYRPSAVRRVYIPKANGKQRPLGIPTASANCTGSQIAFRMGGDPPPVPSTSRPALRSFEGAAYSRY